MKHFRSRFFQPAITSAFLGGWILSGCSDPKPGGPATASSAATAGGPSAGQPQTAAAPVVSAVEFSALTNQWAQVQQAQSELIQRLQAQLTQLDQRQIEQANSFRTHRESLSELRLAPDERSQQLLAKIGELEGKIRSLETGWVLPEIALAAEDGPTTRELDQKIQGVERKWEQAGEAAEAKAKTAPKLSVGTTGLSFESNDGSFSLRIKGLVQTDAQVFLGDNPLLEGNDGFYLRRVRTAVQGTFLKDFNYLIVPQYGGLGQDQVQILDATVGYSLGDYELRVGKFKGPVGLEMLQSITALPFNERSLVSDLVPQRSVGAQLSGSLLKHSVTFAAGIFNSSGDQRNPANFDFSDDREYAGRVFFEPFKNTSSKAVQKLGFGLGGSFNQVSSNALGLPRVSGGNPGYFTSPGNQQFFAYNPVVGPVVADGSHWRLSPQGWYYYGPFGLLGEYALSSQGVYNSSTFRAGRLNHDAWQVSAEWVLTGEAASFNGIIPKRPFTRHGEGWGAWQLVGRFSKFDVDDNAFPAFSNPIASASEATSWSAGVNWWLNRNVRVSGNFTHTSFQGGGARPNLVDAATLTAPATVTAQDESVVSTRVQFSF